MIKEVLFLDELIEKVNGNMENLIYEARLKQVMLNSKISVTKCNGDIVIYYDIVLPISIYNYNFADVSAKLLRQEKKYDRNK